MKDLFSFNEKLQKLEFIVTFHEQIMDFQAREHNIGRLVTVSVKEKQHIDCNYTELLVY